MVWTSHSLFDMIECCERVAQHEGTVSVRHAPARDLDCPKGLFRACEVWILTIEGLKPRTEIMLAKQWGWAGEWRPNG